MKKQFFAYLEFTRSERRGIVVLSALCLIFLLAPEVARLFRKPRTTDFSEIMQQVAALQLALENAPPIAGFPFDPNTATFEDFRRLGLSERVSNTILNYRDKGGRFFDADDFQKIYSLPAADFERLKPFIEIERPEYQAFARRGDNAPLQAAELFAFDPNTATEADFRRLGLSERVARSIANYRSKGGTFRQRADFQKIYLLSGADFRRLEPFIEIAQAAPAGAQAAPRPAAYSNNAQSAAVPKTTLDINRATLEAWQSLPGIGTVRAQKIVYFREKLGGFASVEQVGESRGLPDSVFQLIRPMLAAASPIFRKINLNTATADELGAHPYFDKRQASLILAYRAQHGAFRSVGELANIGAFKNAAWLEKVKPYLTAE